MSSGHILGVALDRDVAHERKQLMVETMWGTVAPSLISTELKSLDFVVLRGEFAAEAERTGNKIYQ